MFARIWSKLISITFLGLTVIGMTGCGSVTPVPETTVTVTTTIPAATRTPRPIPTPTPTLLLFPTAKASDITENCITVERDSEIPYRSDFGALVINSWFYPKWTDSDFIEPYLFTASKQKIILTTKLNMTYFASFAVSPDKTKIAIFNSQNDGNNDLLIFDNNGKAISHFNLPAQFNGARIYYWLREGMLFSKSDRSRDRYILFDPFGEKELPLRTDFPNGSPRGFGSGDSRAGNRIFFDPTLSRAIYLAEYKSSGTLYFSLWDLIANQEISQFKLVSYPNKVAWSSDGEFAIMNVWLGNQFGLVKILRDGKSETVFAGDVHDFSISPDSKFLAFWLVDEYQTDFYTLFMKNLETGNIQSLCLQTDMSVGMVWSPDSKNLAASFEYEGDVITTVIDFEERVAYKIEGVAIPVGWLK